MSVLVHKGIQITMKSDVTVSIHQRCLWGTGHSDFINDQQRNLLFNGQRHISENENIVESPRVPV